jgi:peptide/nickel transport system substrate-binding protein
VVGYPYNPTKAKELLTQAGFANGFKTKITCIGTGSELPYIAAQEQLKKVGIDVQLDLVTNPKLMAMIYGEPWDGILVHILQASPDPLPALNKMFGGPSYKSMIYPEDFIQALKMATAASNQEDKQKYTQEASKLMIDKYCLITPIYVNYQLFAGTKAVHDHGILNVADINAFTPETAWLDKK